jgi:membrane fusion protein (multidrug efflux system)
VLIGFVVLVAACGGGDDDGAPPAVPVVVARVELRDIEDRIEATGELLARDQAAIAAEVPGRITEILRDEGEHVQAGEVVLEIDPGRRQLEVDDARARLAEAQAGLVDKQREVKRVRELRRKTVASQSQLDQAETALSLARARLEVAQAHLGVAERALSDASVTAPFDGLVDERFVSVGEFVQAGQTLFELVALDPIEVEFHLAEKDSSRVAVGHRVDVRVAPFPEEVFPADVSVVSPTIDTRTRTLRVKAEFGNPEGRLRPGLFARVDLGVNRRSNVPMIPEEAVLYRADGTVVFRVQGDRVERKIIEAGVHVDGTLEVVSGLAGGDLIVRRGHTRLIDGSLVAMRNPDGSSVTPPVAEGRPHEAKP